MESCRDWRARVRCVRRERDLAARLSLPLPNTIQDLQQPQEPRQTPTRQKTDPAVNSSAENSSRQQSRDCVCFLRDPEAARGAIFSSGNTRRKIKIRRPRIEVRPNGRMLLLHAPIAQLLAPAFGPR